MHNIVMAPNNVMWMADIIIIIIECKSKEETIMYVVLVFG